MSRYKKDIYRIVFILCASNYWFSTNWPSPKFAPCKFPPSANSLLQRYFVGHQNNLSSKDCYNNLPCSRIWIITIEKDKLWIIALFGIEILGELQCKIILFIFICYASVHIGVIALGLLEHGKIILVHSVKMYRFIHLNFLYVILICLVSLVE